MPHLEISTRLSTTGTEAHLVVDRLVGGNSFGGLRIAESFEPSELRASARCMSRKFGFWGLPHGGAKAVLVLPSETPRAIREATLGELGGRWRQVLGEGTFQPAIDAGSERRDVALVWRGAGLPDPTSPWPARSHVYTAWSLLATAEAILEGRGAALANTRVSIQGLGRVGVALLAALAERRACVVAVSEREGSLADPEGLDAARILAAREAREPLSGGLGPFDPDGASIWTQPTELLFACATAEAFSQAPADRMRAVSVIPAANGLCDLRVTSELEERGVLVVPEFVAGGGGVFGSFLDGHLDERAILEFVEAMLAPELGRWIALARERGEKLRTLLTEAAESRFESGDLTARSRTARLGRRFLPRLPLALRRSLLRRWLRSRTFPPSPA